MKKIILSVLTIMLFSSAFAQKEGKLAPADCPVGTFPMLTIEVTMFNFHKPRTNCTSGFGLCIRIESEWSCSPISTYRTESSTRVENGKVYCWGLIQNGKLELHIPAEIRREISLSSDDVSVFSVEDAAITSSANGRTYTTKSGNYNTELQENDLVVLIDLQ